MSDRPFRDAEAWLAERGVRRDPLRVPTEPPEPPDPGGPEPLADGAPAGGDPASGARSAATTDTAPGPDGGPPAPPHVADLSDPGAAREDTPPMTAREAARLAASSADETLRRTDEGLGGTSVSQPRLEDEVADAVSFVQRSTANTPQAEGRLTEKLRERGWGESVVEQAMERCRRIGLVDDAAMAAALVEEGRRKGHAPRRLRADLRRRGLGDDVIRKAMAGIENEDPEAAAFAVARDKARTLTGVDAETAFRRIVGHLARRGHPEALARKVARSAVFDARDAQRTAER